jgi:putative heme iron utilization protein
MIDSPKIEQAKELYYKLINSRQSIIIGTVDAEGQPYTSYAPFVIDEAKNIYFLASELAIHTQHLLHNSSASILLIEDEAKTQQIFARCRLNFTCKVKEIKRDHVQWQAIIAQLENRFGEIVTMISSLQDFHLFQLIPQEGRFVMGFGGTYKVSGGNLEVLTPVNKI